MSGSQPPIGVVRLIAFLSVVLLTACHRNSSDQSAYMRNLTAPSATPSPPLWPSYYAEDYRTFDKKTLTRNEVSLIRKTLSLVKPCQRRILRFAFPSNAVSEFPLVLFFQEQDYVWPHALWTHNMFYKPVEGEVFPAPGPEPDWNGVRYDVEHTACDGRHLYLKESLCRCQPRPPPHPRAREAASR